MIIAKGRADATDEVELAAVTIVNTVRLCRSFRTLPVAGGLLDQDALFMYYLELVEQFDQERAELDKTKG